MSKRRRANGRSGRRRDLRPLLQQRRAIMREKPDELTAPGRGKIGFCQGALTDKVALVLAECPGETNVIRGYGAIRILPYDDVALFGAEHVHGLGAIGATAKRLHSRIR